MKKICQLVAHLNAGDAISGQVLLWDEIFKSWGYQSKIYARFIDRRNLPGRAREFKKELFIAPEELIIFHLSDYTEISEFIKNLPNRKILIYHNITPAYFFRGMAASALANAALGRFWLKKLAPYFDLALGVSEYNRKELVEYGYQLTGVLPLIFDERIYRTAEASQIFKKPGGVVALTQFLTVGRIAPNKKIEDVIRLFYFYNKFYNGRARLLIVGRNFREFEKYQQFLQGLVKDLGLSSSVIFTGVLKQKQLNNLYRESDFYLTLSEHEGFCLPILEAFYFGLPVLALLAGGVPQTMGGAGLLVSDDRVAFLAELLDYVLKNPVLTDKIISGQKKVLEKFSRERVTALMKEYLAKING